MQSIYQFDEDFCNALISVVDKNQCYSFEVGTEITEGMLEPTNAYQFEINTNSDENLFINNIINNYIKNVMAIKNVIQILDKDTKHIPHKFNNPYVFMSVLNNDFIGGRVAIDNILSSPKKGEFISISPFKSFNVEQIIDGDRYCLISYVDINFKNNKSII
jgi:hypothetical protein